MRQTGVAQQGMLSWIDVRLGEGVLRPSHELVVIGEELGRVEHKWYGIP